MADTKNLGLKMPEQTNFYNVAEFNENFQKIDDFLGRRDNPLGVTADQVVSLKIYNSFTAINKELGTSFDATTPITNIIQAMPDNTGLTADISAVNTDIYPTVYGILTIYKIRENRVAVEYVSLASYTHGDYNKRWVGQYTAGVFGGFKLVFTEATPPTADQVKAIPSSDYTPEAKSGDSYNLNDVIKVGFYRVVSQNTNIPTVEGNGALLMVIPWDNNTIIQVFIAPSNTNTKFFVRAKTGGNWGDWSTELLTNKGGLIKGSLNIYKNSLPALEFDTDKAVSQLFKNANDDYDYGTVLRDSDSFDVINNYVSVNLSHKTAKNDLNSAFSFGNIVNGVGDFYIIHGAHNKPTGTYNGTQSPTSIPIGGRGNILIVVDMVDKYTGIITPTGACDIGPSHMTWLSGYFFQNGVLNITENKTLFNTAGRTYSYQVL